MKKIKFTSLNILKLNNKIYLPYQLHQLPKWFNKFNIDYFNLKGYCYISIIDIKENNTNFNYKNYIDTMVFHKSYNYTNHK